ncbi:MAG: hypothetical protein ACFE9N_15435 [Promethearchaeota archaeon]
MKVKKISIHPEKIIIDLVLCPKTKLYLQSLYCHRCGYFKSDEENNIDCNYKKPQIENSDHPKDVLIKLFSEIKKKNGDSSQQLENIDKKDEIKFNLEVLKTALNREIKKKKNFIIVKES